MSQWTHVSGLIRVDGMPGVLPESSVQFIKHMLGPMSLWDAWDDASRLPRGSEGSIQYRVIEYDKGLPWAAIAIWGDLRDYSDVEAITAWWSETLAAFKLIRSGVLLIEVEGRAPVVLTHAAPSTVALPGSP